MIALVDYDNVPELEKNRGPVHVIERVVLALASALATEREARFRLYGGWFERSTLSRRAQQILPVLANSFPRMVTSPNSPGGQIRVRAELALGLDFEPKKHLTHTYRDRALPTNIRCAPVPYSGCRTPGACPIASVHALLRDSSCPELGCGVTVDAILTKPEQKLVDTMLTVDIVHLARTTSEAIAIVSADDDLWPGIQAAVAYGAKVLHVHPLPGRTTPQYYASLASGNYTQSCF